MGLRNKGDDDFFSQKSCTRCGGDLSSRIQSWFTDDTICTKVCGKNESLIRSKLPDHGRDFEGCGYVPGVAPENDPILSVGEEYPKGTWFYDTKEKMWYVAQNGCVKEPQELSEREANEKGLFREA